MIILKITSLLAIAFISCQTNSAIKLTDDEAMITPELVNITVSSDTTTTPTKKPEIAMLPGERLIRSSDCLVCHDQTNQIIGPSFSAISKKYAEGKANVNLLASKIIEGGSGNWGNTPMQAHPNVTKEDAEEMIHFILSFK